MKMEVITPEENMGDIVGDINRRRGQVNDMGDRAGAKLLRQMCHYQKCLVMLTLRTFHLVEQHLLWNFHITRKLLLIFQKQ
jgi:hypothetical protein